MMDALFSLSVQELLAAYPEAQGLLRSLGIAPNAIMTTLPVWLDSLSEAELESLSVDKSSVVEHVSLFLEAQKRHGETCTPKVQSITVIGGYDKLGNKENVSITFRTGDILCIVGATGSGKSRLLCDIECLAQGDTPTKRHILINGQIPPASMRFSVEHKMVAQLSQNMNFIMDISVEEFVHLHAQSRMIKDMRGITESILACANELAGEKFTPQTALTALSGGQSRALMIADTALLSASPIVLIDELENAGVDRRKSLELLMKREKIVLMSTHDPILALMGNRRLVIKNGGISRVLQTSETERAHLETLQRLDAQMMGIRSRLRNGEVIDTINFEG